MIFPKNKLTHDVQKFASKMVSQATEDTASLPSSNSPSAPYSAGASIDPPGNEGGRAGDHANDPDTPGGAEDTSTHAVSGGVPVPRQDLQQVPKHPPMPPTAQTVQIRAIGKEGAPKRMNLRPILNNKHPPRTLPLLLPTLPHVGIPPC